MHYIYILINESGKRTYVGMTSDLKKRIIEHNEGRVKSSKPFRPYELVQAEKFKTYRQAREKERFYKSTSGRRALKEIIEEYKYIKMNLYKK